MAWPPAASRGDGFIVRSAGETALTAAAGSGTVRGEDGRREPTGYWNYA